MSFRKERTPRLKEPNKPGFILQFVAVVLEVLSLDVDDVAIVTHVALHLAVGQVLRHVQ